MCVEDDNDGAYVECGVYNISLIIISFIYVEDVACYCDEAINPMQ